jgi:hypothetical protein
MLTGYSVVYRMTAAEFAAGSGLSLTGGFIEIVDASGIPTGVVYVTGALGSVPVQITNDLASYRTTGEHVEHFRIVYDVDGVTCMKSDPTDISKCITILGMTVADTPISTTAEIIGHGEIALTSGLPAGQMWLGAAGTITQVAPTTGVLVHLGWVANTGLMYIDIGTPIVLS